MTTAMGVFKQMTVCLILRQIGIYELKEYTDEVIL